MIKIKPLRYHVLGFFINPPGKGISRGGIIVPSDDMKNRGIKPRWFEIEYVGKDHEEDFEKGDLVYVLHGRWSRGHEVGDPDRRKLHKIDTRDILVKYLGDKDDLRYLSI